MTPIRQGKTGDGKTGDGSMSCYVVDAQELVLRATTPARNTVPRRGYFYAH